MQQVTKESVQIDEVCPGGLAATGALRVSEFRFECGTVLSDMRLHFQTWGTLNSTKTNAVLVCHALTGDANAGGNAAAPGWWSGLIGPGCAIDTRKYYVICSNVIGGCTGTTGPSSVAQDGQPYALRFPLVTVRDMVQAQVRLLDALGVNSLAMVVGGSLGGMQAWEWAISAPERVRHTVVIAAHAAFPPLAIGYNEAMRQAIMADVRWNGGNYYGTGSPPTAGLAAARTIGMLTYRTNEMYRERFGRRQVADVQDPASTWNTPRYEVESYLQHHGQKLNSRFDANSYLYLTRAMDDHDIGRDRGGIPSALAQIRSRLTVIGIPGDYLYGVEDLKATAELARQCGVDCRFETLPSIHGHDAFLIEQVRLGEILVRAGGGSTE